MVFSCWAKLIQKTQNKLTRMLNCKKISDKISTKELLKNINSLSVNQLNAQIKITEIWKAKNLESYPLKIHRQTTNVSSMEFRSRENGSIKELYGSDTLRSTFINDAIKVWNLTPVSIKKCKSLFSVKREIKKFVSTLPI